jgi:hypothetical protein
MSAIRGEDEEIIAGVGEGPEAVAILRDKLEQLVDTGALPYYQLLFSDWVALLFNFFAFSYGEDMHVRSRCPYCKEISEDPYGFSLEDLPCLVYENVFERKEITEPFTSPTLPPYDDVVNFRLLRLQDMVETEKYFQNARRAGKTGDFIRSYATAKHILAVNDEEVTLFEALDWVRNGATGAMLKKLRQEFNRITPGYEMAVYVKCHNGACRGEFPIKIPEDGSFFRSEDTVARKSAAAKVLDDELRSGREDVPGVGGDGAVAEGGFHHQAEPTHQGDGAQEAGSAE